MRLRLFIPLLTLGILIPAATAQTTRPADLKKLFDEIARGAPQDATDATDELIEQFAAPLAAALADLERRPLAEQIRIAAAVQRLYANLQMRLFRNTLPEEDRRLFDSFAKQRPRVVEDIFHEDYEVRERAFESIPLEPGTAAGLLIATKVAYEGEIPEQARRLAAELHDEVLIRTLIRILNEEMARIKGGFYGGGEPAFPVAATGAINQAIRLLNASDAKMAVPAVAEAVRFFPGSPYADVFDMHEAIATLGRMGDESVGDVLYKRIGDGDIYRSSPTRGGRLAVQTGGDVALIALVRIYGLSPADFGIELDGEGQPAGFADEATRLAARRMFTEWYDENAKRPKADRKPPASRPATTRPANASPPIETP